VGGWGEGGEGDEQRGNLYGRVDIGKPPYSEKYPDLGRLLENPYGNDVFMNVFEGVGKRFTGAPLNTRFIWNK